MTPLCGATRTCDGRAPLVCNLEAGHVGDHGIRSAPGLPPYVRWRASEVGGVCDAAAGR
jgi:hypothetical protein